MKMLTLAGAGAALATVLTLTSTAQAAQGCGPGFHRGPWDGCRPNYGPGFAPALGVFYPGRGWWDGHRYWGHRDRWHGGWRYR